MKSLGHDDRSVGMKHVYHLQKLPTWILVVGIFKYILKLLGNWWIYKWYSDCMALWDSDTMNKWNSLLNGIQMNKKGFVFSVFGYCYLKIPPVFYAFGKAFQTRLYYCLSSLFSSRRLFVSTWTLCFRLQEATEAVEAYPSISSSILGSFVSYCYHQREDTQIHSPAN